MTGSGFTAGDYARRRRQALADAADAGLAGLLVTPGPDLAYLTGYAPHLSERLTVLVLTGSAEPTLLVPRLERPGAQAAPGVPGVALHDWLDGTDPYPLVAGLLSAGGRYGISDAAWALHLLGLQRAAPGTGFASLTDALPMLRAVKDDREVELLAAAGAAADAAFAGILAVPFAGRAEREVAADLADLLRAHGHEQVGFTIVAAGPNGANPHHDTGGRVIVPGDLIVLDFGGLRDGYGSDISRTVSVGPPGPDQIEVYQVVQAAQQAGVDAVRPGVPCAEVDRAARAVITAAGYGQWFIHRTGHGIGLTGHEPPYLVDGEAAPLVPGMCFSVEPGIYLPGRFGVRIEDIVTCTPTGARRLNTASRDLHVVG